MVFTPSNSGRIVEAATSKNHKPPEKTELPVQGTRYQTVTASHHESPDRGLTQGLYSVAIPARPNRSRLVPGVIVDANLGDAGQCCISTQLEDSNVETERRQCRQRCSCLQARMVRGQRRKSCPLWQSAVIARDTSLGAKPMRSSLARVLHAEPDARVYQQRPRPPTRPVGVLLSEEAPALMGVASTLPLLVR